MQAAATWRPKENVRPEDAGLFNRLLRRRVPVAAVGLAVSMCAAPAGTDVDMEAFPLRLAGEPAVLEAPRALVDAVLAALDPVAPAAGAEVRRLLLELALENALDALDPVLPVELGDAGFDVAPVAGLVLGLRCEGGGTVSVVRLRLGAGAAERLAAALDRVALAPLPLDALRVPVHLRVGSCTLPLDELRTLHPGDVLMPERGGGSTFVAVVGERLVWHGDWDGRTAAVGTPRQAAGAAGAEEWTMGDEMPPDAAGMPDAELNELPVRLVFEVGRVELTLGELSTVGPGHVFALPGGAPGMVDILASGRRIGQGELVQLGDGTGVRLLSLAGRPPGQG